MMHYLIHTEARCLALNLVRLLHFFVIISFFPTNNDAVVFNAGFFSLVNEIVLPKNLARNMLVMVASVKSSSDSC